MIHINKILVPMDFSVASNRALLYGFVLAAQFKAKLVATHIVPQSSALAYAFPIEASAIEQDQFVHATKELQNLLSQVHGSNVESEAFTKIGEVDAELLRIVADQSVDLVVMGTHGRRYAGRWFLGSVTERMLRKLPVPLVTVCRVDDGKHLLKPRLASLRRILYAADAPEPSPAFDYAFELAQRTEATLTVIHVVEYLNLSYTVEAHVTNEAGERVKEMHRRFDEFFLRTDPDGTAVEVIIRDGKPYKQILDIAEERDMDLIVLNMHSKGVLERAFLGSTAERVVRLAEIPVLSVPATTFAAEKALS